MQTDGNPSGFRFLAGRGEDKKIVRGVIRSLSLYSPVTLRIHSYFTISMTSSAPVLKSWRESQWVTRKLDVTGPLKRYILAAHMAAGSNKWRDAAVAWRSAFDIAQVCIFLIFFSPPPLPSAHPPLTVLGKKRGRDNSELEK